MATCGHTTAVIEANTVSTTSATNAACTTSAANAVCAPNEVNVSNSANEANPDNSTNTVNAANASIAANTYPTDAGNTAHVPLVPNTSNAAHAHLISNAEPDNVSQAMTEGDKRKSELLILKILRKCKYENAVFKKIRIPLEDYEDRVQNYTGISKNELDTIQGKKYSTLRGSDTLNTHLLVLRCLHNTYYCRQLPNYRTLFKKLNEKVQTSKDIEKFNRRVTQLGISYHPIFGDELLLMEDPILTFERFSYLKKIKEERQKGSLIYYVSTRILNYSIRSSYNPCVEHRNPSRHDCAFFHAISREGLAKGSFYNNPTADNFYQWLVDHLLRSLRSSSVIVLDDGPYHGLSKRKDVTAYDSKEYMWQWLQERNIPHHNLIYKSQLYDLIQRNRLVEPINKVERVIQWYGHKLLRMPKNFECLTPVEYVWDEIKWQPSLSLMLREDILARFEYFPLVRYQICEIIIEKYEDRIIGLDSAMDKSLNYIITEIKKCYVMLESNSNNNKTNDE